VVRTCQNSLGQDVTCLGLLLLHVGPNGDGFGGQAFMEDYSMLHWGICGGIALSSALHVVVYAPPIDCDSHHSPST
jgi:hypothetical protein